MYTRENKIRSSLSSNAEDKQKKASKRRKHNCHEALGILRIL